MGLVILRPIARLIETEQQRLLMTAAVGEIMMMPVRVLLRTVTCISWYEDIQVRPFLGLFGDGFHGTDYFGCTDYVLSLSSTSVSFPTKPLLQVIWCICFLQRSTCNLELCELTAFYIRMVRTFMGGNLALMSVRSKGRLEDFCG